MTRTEWIKDLARRIKASEHAAINKANEYANMARANLVPALTPDLRYKAQGQLKLAAYQRKQYAKVMGSL